MNDTGQWCLTTVDGVDFMVPELTPFLSKWWSHKFKGPGLWYEISICIVTGWIVSYNGPFECGHWPDVKIFWLGMKTMLMRGKMVVADHGYCGDLRI